MVIFSYNIQNVLTTQTYYLQIISKKTAYKKEFDINIEKFGNTSEKKNNI